MESTSNPPFPFLRLPVELRNKIYKYVFSGWEIWPVKDRGNIIRLRCFPDTGPDYNNWRLYKNRLKTYAALTKTCRQIHQEARLLPFKYCVIHNWCRMDHLALWLNRMDEDMRKIVLAGLTDKQKWCLGERSERKKRIMDL
jgi:hypothetical protein